MYIFYSLTLFLLIFATLAYSTRSFWVPLLPYSIADFNLTNTLSSLRSQAYAYTPLSTDSSSHPDSSSSFEEDIESGLSSTSFDLSTNIMDGDARAGLDDEGKREVLKIMRGSWCRPSCTFDEARQVQVERQLLRMGIGKDGMPRDPKLVSFG